MGYQPVSICFAITSHGLGHLTRTLAVAKEFFSQFREIQAVISTVVSKERVAQDFPFPFIYRPVDYEPGTAQKNCFEVDNLETRSVYQQFLSTRQKLLSEEQTFLKKANCHGVVSDIPALAVKAAANVGIPAVGLSNFTWDWILEPILNGTEMKDLPKLLADDYRHGRVHLQLPFGPDTSPFPQSECMPLIGRHARFSAAEVRTRLNLPHRDRLKLVVVCPGGWEPNAWEPIKIKGCEAFRFIFIGDLPITANVPCIHLPHAIPFGLSMPDLINTAEVVLAKPGYGMASECVIHRTPLVVIERPNFRETPVLLETLRAMGKCAEISLQSFFSGNWESSLTQALDNPTPWQSFPENAVQIVAERLGVLFDLGKT